MPQNLQGSIPDSFLVTQKFWLTKLHYSASAIYPHRFVNIYAYHEYWKAEVTLVHLYGISKSDLNIGSASIDFEPLFINERCWISSHFLSLSPFLENRRLNSWSKRRSSSKYSISGFRGMRRGLSKGKERKSGWPIMRRNLPTTSFFAEYYYVAVWTSRDQ